MKKIVTFEDCRKAAMQDLGKLHAKEMGRMKKAKNIRQLAVASDCLVGPSVEKLFTRFEMQNQREDNQ
jgi:hypothetical protein